MNLITTNRRDDCGVCLGTFNCLEQAITHVHVQEQGHSGFHKRCLEVWLNQNLVCPYGCGDIDRGSLDSITCPADKIKQVALNVFSTNFLVLALYNYSLLIIGVAIMAQMTNTTERISRLNEILCFSNKRGLELVLGTGFLMETIVGAKIDVFFISKTIFYFTAARAVQYYSQQYDSQQYNLYVQAVNGISVFTATILTNIFFEINNVNLKNRKIIGLAIYTSSLAGLIVPVESPLSTLTTSLTMCLVGTVAATFFSLFK